MADPDNSTALSESGICRTSAAAAAASPKRGYSLRRAFALAWSSSVRMSTGTTRRRPPSSKKYAFPSWVPSSRANISIPSLLRHDWKPFFGELVPPDETVLDIRLRRCEVQRLHPGARALGAVSGQGIDMLAGVAKTAIAGKPRTL
ncbi:MAG: hypothetical protein R3F11_23360 [Verrucomicrobiales bacterium]